MGEATGGGHGNGKGWLGVLHDSVRVAETLPRSGVSAEVVRRGGRVNPKKPATIRFWWFAALLLAALGLIMGGAHVLEHPVRVRYDPELYFRVTSTMYRYFAVIGGPVQVLAIIASAILLWLTRGSSGAGWTLVGMLLLVLSLLLWFLRVQPVNDAWLTALNSHPESVVEAYARLRARWEWGHVMAFAAWLLGFGCLLHSGLRRAD